jgi:septal ring factor EnvC (AmiA/AmiB activator)
MSEMIRELEGKVSDLEEELAAVTKERDELQDQVNAERDAKYAVKDQLAASQAENARLRDVLENLVAVKGRHHTEMAYKRCVEALAGESK